MVESNEKKPKVMVKKVKNVKTKTLTEKCKERN